VEGGLDGPMSGGIGPPLVLSVFATHRPCEASARP